MHASTLRRRIFETLATSTLLTAACGGQSTGTSGGLSSGEATSSGSTSSGETSSGATSSGAPTPATCTHGQKERSCFAPDGIITKSSGYGGRAPDPDAAPPPPPTREANGCVVMEEVMNGCCNAAISGPVLEDGKCCYEFCAGACCGRPLVVDGLARVAPPATRVDWAPARSPCVLDGATRDALREAWTRDALLEHASIASFATFTLELLAVGAPADLVAGAQAAAADEIEHARVTFAIAGSYAGGPLGPGPLDVSGVVPSSDLAAIAAACVRDGCVNEAIASAVAAAQAANAVDPELRATLERVADDEAHHAELAWSFVQWALSTGRADVRDAVDAAFDAPVAGPPALPDGIDAAVWTAHGRLLPGEHASVIRSVLEQVVAPCRARLAPSGSRHAAAPRAALAVS
ncbi:MAG: ferritin-like domain-containing protein [Labilithrix sp.]|nr:ferritin-like domain-containing protein [Labilithrix sp.]